MDAGHAAEIVVGTMHVVSSPLPAALVLVPLAAAVLVRPLGKRWPGVRNVYVVVVMALTLLGAAGLIPLIAEHHRIQSVIPALLGELTFTVDSFSMLFALFTSFVWLAATVHSLDYLHHEKKHDRYHTTSLVVLAANLGVVLAGDLVTLYLFFEALGLVAFLLVIHTETDEAKAASAKYLWMTVIGGFALVGGIFLTFALGGSGALEPLPAGGSEALRWVAAILLILGFGVKAGMVPVHVWLPDAHPVAPAPASALLSGVMIKAGAYGIFRVVTALFRPEVTEHVEESLWHFSGQLGLVVLWIGIATMFIGVFLALQQSNAKRMLAYHSVSQMGFILAGIGAAGYLGAHGAMGVAGGLYHVVNHALFKACLFLGVGAVYYRTHSLDLYHTGGLWKKMPVTFVFMCIAAAGITGVPLFNGFVSKCLIHHAIVEAWEYQGLASLGIAEKIYIVTCGGTACSFIKLIGLMFLGKPKMEYGPEVTDAPPRMLLGMGLLATFIVALGWFPQILIKGVFQPGLHTWGLHSDILDHYLQHSFLSGPDLMSVVTAFALGFAFFFVGMRFHLFHLHAPQYFSIDWWYRQSAHALVAACGGVEWIDRQRRLVVSTLLTGAPGARDQRLIQKAYIILERERQDTVRAAVMRATAHLRSAQSPDEPVDQAQIDAVREIAGYMAGRLMHERMGVLSDLMRTGGLDSAVSVLMASGKELARVRTPITRAALDLAPRRMRGETVSREIGAAINTALSDERFDLMVAPRTSVSRVVLGRTAGTLDAARHSLPSRERLADVSASGLTRLEQFAAWSIEMLRLAVDALTRERSQWLPEGRFQNDTVVQTRLGIQRYARDIGLNVGVFFVVLLIFVAAMVL